MLEFVVGEVAITSEGPVGSLIVLWLGEKFFTTKRPNFITRMSASFFKDFNRFPIPNLPVGRDDMTGSSVLVASLVSVWNCIKPIRTRKRRFQKYPFR